MLGCAVTTSKDCSSKQHGAGKWQVSPACLDMHILLSLHLRQRFFIGVETYLLTGRQLVGG